MTIVSLVERARAPRKKFIRPEPLSPIIGAWQGWPGFLDPTLGYVTEAEVLGLSVVGGFLEITTSILLQMPLHAYRESELVQPDPPIVTNPTPGWNRVMGDCMSEYLRDLVLYGNYVALLGPPSANGWPEMLLPVPAGQWSVSSGRYNYEYLIDGTTYQPNEVFHIRVNAGTGSVVGRGLLDLYPGLVSSCVAAERWAAMYFTGGAVPPGVLKHPNPELTQKQADELKLKLKAVAQNREWAILPGGAELEPLDTNAEQAQLNETRRLNDQHMAMALGIPGALLGLDAPSLTYRNITDVFQQFLTTTVMGMLVPFEQQISQQCLPRGIQARFSHGNVLRPDLPARVGLAAQAVSAGLYTPEQAIQVFDLTPKESEQ